jgi:DNA primase
VAKIPEQFIQQVLSATDIVEFIGQYVALKKKGKEFAGLCPFHQDNNPSMYVTPVKQMFKCFVCGAGGNALRFLMDYEKVTFPDAVRALADRVGLEMPSDYAPSAPRGDGLDKRTLFGVAAWAKQFYRDQLFSPAGKAALAYAKDRGLTDETIEQFELGFAPDAWDGLTQGARRKGYTAQQLVEAGLAAPRQQGDGVYDRFRNRLMFPIQDLSGRVVGFGGRALAADERAKYINSPESILFDKSNQMFAMDVARDAIRNSRQAIVVEGYMDAIVAIQSGVPNVVATLGTALTAGHVRQLAHFASDVVLVFDADVAGASAADRALDEFIAQNISVRVSSIPEGKDPADFCLAQSGQAFIDHIAGAPDAMDHMLQRHMAAYRDAGGNLADRGRVVESFLEKVVTSGAYGAIDNVRRGQLVQHIAHLLNLSAGELQQRMNQLGRRITTRSQQPTEGTEAPAQQEYTKRPLVERQVLEVLINAPELFDSIVERMGPSDFSDPGLRLVAEQIWRLGENGPWHLDQLLANERITAMGALVSDLATNGERRGNLEATLTGSVDAIVRRRDNVEIEALKADASDDALRKLTARLRDGDPRRKPKIQ